MGLITQTSPINDTAIAGVSAAYTNQITVVGSTGPLLFETTHPSTSVTVSPSGAISTTGTLALGSFTVSGTVTDGSSDSGTWVFTLNVTGPFSPGTGVTPVLPELPTGLEILVPFQIDSATGGVAVLVDYGSILAQHLATILMTVQGERVMNPQYGIGIQQQVFAPSYIDVGIDSADLQRQLQADEPGVQILSVVVDANPTDPTNITVTVEFAVVPFTDVNTVTVAAGGSLLQVSAQ